MKDKPLNEHTREELEAALARYLNEQTGKRINCRWCGANFKQNRRWQEFCKPACQTAWHKRQKELLLEELQARNARLERELDLYKRLWSRVPADIREHIETTEV